MKVSDKLEEYEAPPEDSVRKDDVRLWREHYIYNDAQADAFKTMLQLFPNVEGELKDWLVTGEQVRREQAEKAYQAGNTLNIKLWKISRHD